MWWGRREGGSGLGTRVHPWRIHVDVWQNQYNTVKKKNQTIPFCVIKKIFCPQASHCERAHPDGHSLIQPISFLSL